MTKFAEIKEKLEFYKNDQVKFITDEWFINKGLMPISGNSWMIRCPLTYIELTKSDDKLEIVLDYQENYDRLPSGLKLHISVAAKDLGKSWDCLEKYLVEKELLFKVAKSGSAIATGNADGQNGKMYTVYFSEDHYGYENEIAETIQTKLKEAGVNPGLNVKGDFKVSDYVYCRHSRVPEDCDIFEIPKEASRSMSAADIAK